jgi:SSS family solute:Na+ symporter
VQRVLAAKNIKQARTGTIFAGYLKILPVFIFVLPGIVAMALFSDVSNNPDSAYPTLVTRLLPDGIKGLVLAGMLAALMSSLASAFNACSTLLTWDVYKKMRPSASEQQLVRVGRISAGVMVFLGLAWIPLMKFVSSQIYIYLQSVQAYIAPPIAACFLLGLFFRRLNGTGAMASLVTGLVLGVLRLVLELTNKATGGLESGTLWHWIATINFLHYAVLLFVICTAVLFVVSMMTPPPPADKTEGLTYVRAGPGGAALLEGETAADRKFQIGLSVLLVAIIGVLWIVFA